MAGIRPACSTPHSSAGERAFPEKSHTEAGVGGCSSGFRLVFDLVTCWPWSPPTLFHRRLLCFQEVQR